MYIESSYVFLTSSLYCSSLGCICSKRHANLLSIFLNFLLLLLHIFKNYSRQLIHVIINISSVHTKYQAHTFMILCRCESVCIACPIYQSVKSLIKEQFRRFANIPSVCRAAYKWYLSVFMSDQWLMLRCELTCKPFCLFCKQPWNSSCFSGEKSVKQNLFSLNKILEKKYSIYQNKPL